MRKFALLLLFLFSSLKASTYSLSLYLSDRLGSPTVGLGGGAGVFYTSNAWDLGLSIYGLQIKTYSAAYYRSSRGGVATSSSVLPGFLQMDLTIRHRGEWYSVGVHSLLNNDTLANIGVIPFTGVGFYRANDYLEMGTAYSLYLGGATLSSLQVSAGLGKALREGMWLDIFALLGQVAGVEPMGLKGGTYPSLGANLRLYLPWVDLNFGGWYGRQLLALKGYGFIAYNIPFVFTDGLFAGMGTKLGALYVAANLSVEGYIEYGNRRTHAFGSLSFSLSR